MSSTIGYTYWLLELLTLQDAGATLAFELLDVEQWFDLRIMKSLRSKDNI